MFYLMKKNSSYMTQVVILLPLLTLAWFFKIRPLDTFHIFMAGMWMVLAVIIGAISGEMIEAKMKGYVFLQSLPIKDRDIVISKFLMAGLTAFVCVVYINILFFFLSGPPHLFALARILTPLFAGAALLLAGLLYVLFFRIGFSRAIKIAWVTFFIVILAPIVILEFVLLKLDVDYTHIFNSIIALSWTVWILIGIAILVGYAGLMTLAAKAKQASKG